MLDRFLSRDACRDLALKWRAAPESPLGLFAATSVINEAVLNEIVARHAAVVPPEQRGELMALGMALAAYRFAGDAATYDALQQVDPDRKKR